jgi:hypothetical protein
MKKQPLKKEANLKHDLYPLEPIYGTPAGQLSMSPRIRISIEHRKKQETRWSPPPCLLRCKHDQLRHLTRPNPDSLSRLLGLWAFLSSHLTSCTGISCTHARLAEESILASTSFEKEYLQQSSRTSSTQII